MVTMAVDEGALANLAEMPEEVRESVERVLAAVKNDLSAKHFEPQSELPDDAPSKIKNEIADGRGRAFQIGVRYDDGSVLFIAWYEPYDRSMIVVWDIHWPANVTIVEE